uniref:Uncharacterized protein n=1 Tax=Anguilla anguilla TaxID=7936 RepID=A0A0E9TPN3_ANGAN
MIWGTFYTIDNMSQLSSDLIGYHRQLVRYRKVK